MDTYKVAAELFYLLVMADGHVHDKESVMGETMVRSEGFDQQLFDEAVENASIKGCNQLLKGCVRGLKELPVQDQERLLAWMCLIANADGFMDNKEWSVIYRIYHDELKLDRESIFRMQRTIRSSMYYLKSA